jgi:hypothetical protein
MSRTFEIADGSGDLGVVYMTPSNIEKFVADFDYYLDRGVLLTGVTVPVTVIDDDAIVNGVGMTNNRRAAVFYVESTDDPAVFDVEFFVTTNDGQTLNYALHFNVRPAT